MGEPNVMREQLLGQAQAAEPQAGTPTIVPRAVIITGPPGCGKSRNAARLLRFYNRSFVIEDWKAGDATPDGALCLTRDIVPGAIPLNAVEHLLPRERSDG